MNFQDSIKLHKVKTKLWDTNTELSLNAYEIIEDLENKIESLESEREHLINEVNTMSATMP